MAVLQHVGKFQGEAASFIFWLKRTVRNKLIDTYRFQHKFRYTLVEPDKLINFKEVFQQNCTLNPSESVKYLHVIEILGQLTRCYREIVYLRYFQQMSFREISKATMIPVNTVKSRLNHAKKKLALIYEKNLGG